MSWQSLDVAHIARRQGEYERAMALFTESMIMAQDMETTESDCTELTGNGGVGFRQRRTGESRQTVGCLQSRL